MDSVSKIFDYVRGDKVIWLLVSFMAFCAILAIYSSTGFVAHKFKDGFVEYYLIKLLAFMVAGFGLMWASYRLNYMVYSKLAPFLFIAAVSMLIYTLSFGTEINDARRWISIPWVDMSFQTSDFARLALIIFVARSIAMKQDNIKEFKEAFLPIIVPVVIVCALIAPADLSTAMLLFLSSVLMMIVGRVSLKYIFLMVLLGVVVLGLLILVGLQFPEVIRVETWISRVGDFFNGEEVSHQVKQAKIAIARGEIFGVGVGQSTQRNFLPLAYADFIYAIICEEYGLVGAFTIIALYLGLLFRCVRIVTRCPKTFGAILAIGLCLNIVVQAFANMAVSVNLVPVTGLTLPIISMGGTSLIFVCISIGIILSISRFVESYSANQLLVEEQAVKNDEI